MDLATELGSFYDNLRRNAPPAVFGQMDKAAKEHEATFNIQAAIKIGGKLPDFSLADETGKIWTKQELLAGGAILLSFQRGGWCPFCNIELRALQKYAHQFRDQGVTLVTASPDRPHESRTRKENMGLDSLMLSDEANDLAAKLGLVNVQPESLRPILSSFDKSFEDSKRSLSVPVPATLLVDATGVVRQAAINPVYHQRLEPATALKWIEDMQKSGKRETPLTKVAPRTSIRQVGRKGSQFGWPA
jgi:peroxiredoxin